MTAISYHDTVKELQGLDWPGDGPFARPEWFALLEGADFQPLYALAQRDKRPPLCLPLNRAEGGLEALTNWYAFTWHSLGIIDSTSETPLVELARDLRRQANQLQLTKLAESDVAILARAFRRAGWMVFRSRCDTNHILPVDDHSFSEYLASRPGRLRTTLKRKAKKVDVTLTSQFSADDWSTYEAIYAQSWKPEEGDPALLQRFAEMESAAGRYRFAMARHNGEPVAAQFWTVDTGTAYIHKLAHLPGAEKLSPGTTLTAALMEHVIDTDKVTLVDFGTGDDGYKRDWMETTRTRYRLVCLRPESPRNWPIIAKSLARRAISKLVSGKPAV